MSQILNIGSIVYFIKRRNIVFIKYRNVYLFKMVEPNIPFKMVYHMSKTDLWFLK